MGAVVNGLILTALIAASARADKQVDAIYPDVDKLYVDLHRNPELAFHEKRTASTLAARMNRMRSGLLRVNALTLFADCDS